MLPHVNFIIRILYLNMIVIDVDEILVLDSSSRDGYLRTFHLSQVRVLLLVYCMY